MEGLLPHPFHLLHLRIRSLTIIFIQSGVLSFIYGKIKWVIFVNKVDGGYKATIAEREDIWGFGKSADEALGNLIRVHEPTFRFSVNVL